MVLAENVAVTAGGAAFLAGIYLTTGNTELVDVLDASGNVSFTNNQAHIGGALGCVGGCSISLAGGYLTGNFAETDGGGFSLYRTANISMNGVTLSSNVANFSGGDGHLLDNCSFYAENVTSLVRPERSWR